MVLNTHVAHAVARERIGRRQVVGVQVVGNHLRLDREQPLKVRDARFERLPGRGVLEVADVVRDPRALALGDAERVLLLGAAREQVMVGRRGERQMGGHVAPRAPQRQRAPAGVPRADDAHDRVVGPGLDRAVVGQKEVGDRRQARQRVVVAERDRLIGNVAAGHHQRVAAKVATAAGDAAACTAASGRARAHPGATAAATGAPGSRGASRIGRWTEVSSSSSSRPSSTNVRAASRSATISANGLSSRCLRDRSVATARSSAASQARWYPPSPLIATTEPAASAAAIERDRVLHVERVADGVGDRQPAGRTADRRSAARESAGRLGPRTRAGNRRTSQTRPSSSAARSYGTPRTIVNRGPQLVQLMNG